MFVKIIYLRNPLLILICIVFILCGCAKIGAPTGGPKDEKPPKLIRAVPDNYSTNFDSKKIVLYFNEYVQLKSASQALIVSPPLKKKPTVVLKGKSVEVTIEDTLHTNTTYALNFGSSIADNNEGNPIDNFRYVLSTGSYIDSISLAGNIISGFDLKPDKEPFLIMLHSEINDSAVYKTLPSFIGRSVADGSFAIENIREGSYKIFAVKDANSNFKYDPYSEPVAFLDTLLVLNNPVRSDTDTVVKKRKPFLIPQMYFFSENENKQFIKNSERKDRRRLDVIFNLPLNEHFGYTGIADASKKFLLERNRTNDSISLWVLDSALYASDSIRINFLYFMPDSNKNKIDTVKFDYFNSEKTKKKKPKTEFNTVKFTPAGSTIDLFQDLRMLCDLPVVSFDTSKMIFSEIVDTIVTRKNFTILRDSLNSRLFSIRYSWLPETRYKLEVYPGAFTDYYNTGNDTSILNVTAQKTEYYGNLILKINHVKSPLIIQMSEKALIKECFIDCDTTLRFPLMRPASYSFKAIYDSNSNRKWDTGNMKKKLQPEKVSFYKEAVNVRSNWDIEMKWDME